MKITLYTKIILVVLYAVAPLGAQGLPESRRPDSTIIFGTIDLPDSAPLVHASYASAWGVDIMLSTNGFGLGTFYRHEYSDDFSGFVDFSISDVKDDNEVEVVDFFGNRFTPGKVNRFLLLPLFMGVQQRLFKDEILDNFRPYVSAAAGPAMIYIFPYNDEYFRALGKGRLKYTVGGYVGAGAYFGSERSNVLGVNMRYYFVPYPSGLESLLNMQKKQFGGFYISLSFGTAW